MTQPVQFILASGSPRRRELLELLNLPFVVVKPDDTLVDETPLPNEPPPDLVHRLSLIKAQAVAAQLPTRLDVTQNQWVIIAADTVVAADNQILGKPAHPAEATAMLKLLRQTQPHYVYSGITVAPISMVGNSAKLHQPITRIHQSRVWMRPYTDADIEAYVSSGDPLDKAGAYAIQNESFAPVKRLDGCFAGVMGLPLGELAIALQQIAISLHEVSGLCSQYFNINCCLGDSQRI
jgi:septum formation protein